MIRTNLTNLITINRNIKKYVNKAYFNNNGMKTVKKHDIFIIDIDDEYMMIDTVQKCITVIY
jgi:hypothetical protein